MPHRIVCYAKTRRRPNQLLFILLSINYYLSITVVTSAPINNNNNNDDNLLDQQEQVELKENFEFIRGELDKYGYLRGNPTLHEFEKALVEFQEVLGVEPTGIIDGPTIEAASKPRCVQRDIQHYSKRSRRFSISKQGKWKHFDEKSHTVTLKYFVSKYTKRIAADKIDDVVKKAFDIWSEQSKLDNQIKVTLNFIKASSKSDADIEILWATGAHGDENNFDGTGKNKGGNVLAHTFYPGAAFPLNGDIHFDDDEDWEVDSSAVTATNNKRFFPYVLIHEIGHALGLSHSENTNAVMHAYYKNVPLSDIKLDTDDKCGINWNYGSNSDFCLFVFLMSEVVHRYNEMSTGYGRDNVSSMSTFRNNNKKQGPKSRLPKCIGNKVKGFPENDLARHLQLSGEHFKTASQSLCNFLAGLHMYRASSKYQSNNSVNTEFEGVQSEVRTFTGASKRSIRDVLRKAEHLHDQNLPSILDPSYFDEKFFDDFFSKLNSSS